MRPFKNGVEEYVLSNIRVSMETANCIKFRQLAVFFVFAGTFLPKASFFVLAKVTV
jgi:hypothetical protein